MTPFPTLSLPSLLPPPLALPVSFSDYDLAAVQKFTIGTELPEKWRSQSPPPSTLGHSPFRSPCVSQRPDDDARVAPFPLSCSSQMNQPLFLCETFPLRFRLSGIFEYAIRGHPSSTSTLRGEVYTLRQTQ